MKKIFCHKSIKIQMILYFSTVFILIFSVFGVIAYKFSSDILIKEIISYSNKIIEESKINIDSYFGQIKTLMQITAGNSVIVEGLKYEKSQDYSKRLYYNRQIEDLLHGVSKFNAQIKDIIVVNHQGYVYNSTGNTIISEYNFYDKEWFPKYPSKFFKVNFIGVHPEDYYINMDVDKERVVSAVMPVMDFMEPNRESFASIICNLKIKKIQELTKEMTLEKSGYFIIIDNNGEVIFKPQNYNLSEYSKEELVSKLQGEKGNFEFKKGSEKIMAIYTTSTETNWKIVALTPKSEIISHAKIIKNFNYAALIIGIFLVIAVSFLISSNITKPITKLMKGMKEVEQGDFERKLYDNSNEEIEKLSSRMDKMIENINALNKDIYMYEIKNKEAELKALQARINPHFLNNTLQSIKAMAIFEKTDEISTMVTLLGNMLRYAIYNSEDLVYMEEEINHVIEYLTIQNYRYPNKFTYEIICSKEIKRMKTIKLILQPIVENSIIHGLQENIEGTIKITINKVLEGIKIQVEDDGTGIKEEKLREINHRLDNLYLNHGEDSIGIVNVHERIRLKFGKSYGLSIHSRIGINTNIIILIPEIREE